jgi:hypothetical protein
MPLCSCIAVVEFLLADGALAAALGGGLRFFSQDPNPSFIIEVSPTTAAFQNIASLLPVVFLDHLCDEITERFPSPLSSSALALFLGLGGRSRNIGRGSGTGRGGVLD